MRLWRSRSLQEGTPEPRQLLERARQSPLPDVQPRAVGKHTHTNTCACEFMAVLTTAKQRKQPKRPPAGERVNQVWSVHTAEHHEAPRAAKLGHLLPTDDPEIMTLGREATKGHTLFMKCPKRANL